MPVHFKSILFKSAVILRKSGFLCQRSRRLCSKPPERLKILFFGTDNFSLPTLQTLHNHSKCPCSKLEIVNLEVCCSKMKDLVSTVRKYSSKNELQILEYPPDLKYGQFDLGVVASFGHLIPEKVIRQFPLGVLNVHASLLPKYRGATPILHAIMNGEKETGISIMEVKPKKFDIGRVLARESCDILPQETSKELTEKMSKIGARLMLEVIKDLEHFYQNSVIQDEENVSYAPLLKKTDFEINWSEKSSKQVYNQYRALSDISKLYSYWKETRTIVRFSDIVTPDLVDSLNLDVQLPGAEPGRTIFINRKKQKPKQRFLCIKCQSGWVAFNKFYYQERKQMLPLEFYNGFMQKLKDKELYFTNERDF